MLLTDKTIAALCLPDGKNELVVFDQDLPGFGIRLRRGGSRRYVFQYKLGSRHRKMTFQAESATAARAIATKLKARVTLGEDIAATKNEAREAAADTFEFCMQRYLAWLSTSARRPRTVNAITRHLSKNLAGLHHHHIKTVSRRHVADELAKMSARAPVQANRTRSSLSRFLNWCLSQGYVDANVALGTGTNDEASRDRVLSEKELQTVWNALPEEGDYRGIVQLLILTGQRVAEISDLRWSEIDLDNGVINLPASRTKNRRSHVVPLSDPVIAALKARQANADSRQFVFGNGRSGFSGFSQSKGRLDARAPLATPWVLHDLRRTFATGAAELGTLPHVVEAMLNHAGGVARGGRVGLIYNRATYLREARTAMNLWAGHVVATVAEKPKRKAA